MIPCHVPPFTLPHSPDIRNAMAIDLATIPMVQPMERNGLELDIDRVHELDAQITRLKQEKSDQITSYIPQSYLDKFVDDSINLDSPEQVADLLFGYFNIGSNLKVELKTTPSGDRVSTGRKQLELLAQAYASQSTPESTVLRGVLDYRQLSKLQTTYVHALPKMVVWHPKGEGCAFCGHKHYTNSPRIHTTIVLTRTSTGRYSSRNPNLQNIPAQTELGRAIRACFRAGEGYVLVCNDHSQIELRMLAHLSNERSMISVFKQGLDIHTATAAEIFGKPLDKVDKIKERLPTKNVNFAIVYGESPKGLMLQLAEMGISWDIDKCEDFIENKFFRVRPNVKVFMTSEHTKARRYEMVWDISGGIRRIPEVRSEVRKVIERGLRQAGNHGVQGSSAVVMKLGMIVIGSELVSNRWECKGWVKPCMTIHDELMHEVLEDKAGATDQWMRMMMEGVCELDVPLKVDGKVDKRWVKD